MDDNKSTELSIVVPTYKEQENIRALIERIAAVLGPRGLKYEIAIVDDNSRDGTEETICELVGEGYPVKLMTRLGRRGLSSAVI